MCEAAHWVVGIKIAHRHLKKGQLAMAGAKLKRYYAEKAEARQVVAGKERHGQLVENLPPADSGKARDQAAAKVGVSAGSADLASPVAKILFKI